MELKLGKRSIIKGTNTKMINIPNVISEQIPDIDECEITYDAITKTMRVFFLGKK